MKVHTLNIDSSHRDPTLYTNPNNYTVTLDNPIYDVSQIKLVSARIPTSQLLICETNNKFDVIDKTSGAAARPVGQDPWISIPSHLTSLYPVGNYTTVTLQTGNYTGASLATEINNRLIGAGISYDANDNTFNSGGGYQDFVFLFKTGTRGYDSNMLETTPYQILGSGPEDFEVTDKLGAANLKGPNSLVLKVTSGSDGFDQRVFTSTPFYTGHILLDGSDVINFNGVDDPLVHQFHSGSQKIIKELTINFFYMSYGRLIPYDFRNQDHVLKFEITCSTDKLQGLPKVPLEVVEKALPPPISIPEMVVDTYQWKDYLSIGIIIFIGMVLLLLMNRKPKLSE